jgi:transcriptional regulator with XRE-family HTH domain
MPSVTRRSLSAEEHDDALRLRSLLREAKATRGLTQAAIARHCGWAGQQAVQAYVSGIAPLNLESVVKFSRALDVPVDAISPRFAKRIEEMFWATVAGNSLRESLRHRVVTVEEPRSDYRVCPSPELERTIDRLRESHKGKPAEVEKLAQAILILLGS